MGFLDDLKKTAADAQHAIERQVDKMQQPSTGAPQPPPLDGAAPVDAQGPPPVAGQPPTGPPVATAAPDSQPPVLPVDAAPPPSLPQPSSFPQPSNASQPLTPPGPTGALPAGPQIRAVEQTLPGSPGPASANPLPPPQPPSE
jgi:hypothetical protein